MLAEVFKNRWKQLTGGMPILASSNVYGAYSLAAFHEMWNEFSMSMRGKRIEPGYMFKTKMNDREIWLIFDGQVYTFMFPEDY